MENTLTLLFDIQVPVYDEKGKQRKENLCDNELCTDIIRLYFLKKLDKVYIQKESSMDVYSYSYETRAGDKVQYRPKRLSKTDISKIIADKRGGKRQGAGRNNLLGESTTIRVPKELKDNMRAIVDIYLLKEKRIRKSRTSTTEQEKAIKWITKIIGEN